MFSDNQHGMCCLPFMHGDREPHHVGDDHRTRDHVLIGRIARSSGLRHLVQQVRIDERAFLDRA